MSDKFNIAYYSKALVPLILIVVYYVNRFFDLNIQLGETEAVFLTSMFLSALVFFIPNKLPDSVTVEIPVVPSVEVPDNVVIEPKVIPNILRKAR